jgi:hypothetical protein
MKTQIKNKQEKEITFNSKANVLEKRVDKEVNKTC